VALNADNQVLFHYLRKGGDRKNPFNKVLQPFFQWLMDKQIILHVKWVPSAACQADPISRWTQDRGDYSLNPHVFQKIQKFFQPPVSLEVDLFASPGNRKLPVFVARWPHWEAAAVDALQAPLEKLGKRFYCNPSWSIIGQFLPRIKEFPNLLFLMVVPFWASSTWFAPLIKMRVPHQQVSQDTPLQGFIRQLLGGGNATPRWDLICILCSGKYDQGSKFKIPHSKISSEEILQSNDTVCPPEASLEQVADGIIQIFQVSPSLARNAYSGALFVTIFGTTQVRFSFEPLQKVVEHPRGKVWCFL
jgi:hypothetical protein